jgi:hypothetical protein
LPTPCPHRRGRGGLVNEIPRHAFRELSPENRQAEQIPHVPVVPMRATGSNGRMGSMARPINATQQPDLRARRGRMHVLLAAGAPLESVLDALRGLQKFTDPKPYLLAPKSRRRRRAAIVR